MVITRCELADGVHVAVANRAQVTTV